MTISPAGPFGQDDRGQWAADTVARLAEQEAVQRLELVSSVSRVFSRAVDEYRPQLEETADVCVPEFCDLLAVELVDHAGGVDLVTLRCSAASGVQRPDPWTFLGTTFGPGREPVLAYRGGRATPAARSALDLLAADSLIVAPIPASGLTLGWLVLATGPRRRGFRPSATRVAADLALRLGAVLQRVMLVHEARVAARDHARTARWLRRVASVAAGVAGAATPQEVLEAGCVEACNVHNADGVAIDWTFGTQPGLQARAGWVDPALADEALARADPRRPTRGERWLSWPLPCSDPAERATIVLFLDRELEPEEEISLRSLASLIPIAFDRARATETTARQEAYLRTVLEASPAALLTLQPDGTVDSANAAARQLFDAPPEPEPWSLPGAIREPVRRLASEAAAAGTRRDAAVAAGDFDLAVSAAPLPGEVTAGGPPVVVVATDLSEQHRAERALSQAQKLEAMGQVAGRVAHDFNNLLTLIAGYSQVLSRSVRTQHERRLLQQMDQATDRAAGLTRQMLGLTRRQVGLRQAVDLTALVSSLEGVLGRLAGDGIHVDLSLPSAPLTVDADPADVEQVLLNLAINARDAMGDRGALTVRVDAVDVGAGSDAGTLPEGSYARLTVADDGPGMSADVLERCMEPFFTTKAHGAGSGLGLPSVLAAATDLGGTVEVTSAPGEGTSVEAWFPRAATREAGPEVDGSDAPAASVTGLRVLVAEDDPELRSLMTEALTAAGAVVTARAGGEELAGAAETGRPDVLITDVRLPGMSGLELAARLRSGDAGLPVLFVTGYADPLTDRLDSLPGPAPRLLRKPFRPDDLQAAVAAVVRGQGSKR